MPDKIPSKRELLSKMQVGWDDLQQFIKGLSVAELTEPTDAAGWTVKDHIMHMAVWEDGMNAMLAHQPRYARMGVEDSLWEQDVDVINDVIWKQHQDKPLDDVLQTYEIIHQQLIDKIETLADEDLARPYSYYQPESIRFEPVIGWLIADTYEHYEEHTPWMAAIVGR